MNPDTRVQLNFTESDGEMYVRVTDLVGWLYSEAAYARSEITKASIIDMAERLNEFKVRF